MINIELMQKFKIGILGIGGVGGYFGGKLAAYYHNSDEVQVIFIARGENKNVIKEHGVKIIALNGQIVAYPALVSDDAQEIGMVDLLICCTKTYQVAGALQGVQACINNNTVILPLMNGVESVERITDLFPNQEIWEGCVYVVSRLERPGIIKKSGYINKLYLGSPYAAKEKLAKVESLLKVDGIDAHVPPNISETVWEKFLFISTMATLTSYLDKSIGQILSNEEYKRLLNDLLNELFAVTIAKGISLPANSIQQTFDKMTSFPFDATSSMHSDFQKGTKTEVDSLTGYVVQLGKELNVSVPTYEMMYKKLKTSNT
jgi:2-dehydropantoate 2-reductase